MKLVSWPTSGSVWSATSTFSRHLLNDFSGEFGRSVIQACQRYQRDHDAPAREARRHADDSPHLRSCEFFAESLKIAPSAEEVRPFRFHENRTRRDLCKEP